MNKEYKINSGWKWYFRIGGVLEIPFSLYEFSRLILMLNMGSRGMFDLGVRIYLFFFFLFFGVQFLYRGYYERVIVSKVEIQYYAFGYSIRTDWNKLNRIGNYGVNEIEGIFLNSSSDDLNRWRWLPRFLFPKEKFIPLGIFFKNWRDSELGQQIKQYAPHLFQ